MILTKEFKIKKTSELTNEYIESELKKAGFDVLRWAITDIDNDFYTINLAVVENDLK